jgi:hypothetical protein
MSALGAPRVLLTRARRDGRSPTVASRLWLRLQAMTGGVTRDGRLERLALALDRPDTFSPVDRPRRRHQSSSVRPRSPSRTSTALPPILRFLREGNPQAARA